MPNKNIRIVLTAALLLIGGYYIQQTPEDVNTFSGSIAKADIPTGYTGEVGGGGK